MVKRNWQVGTQNAENAEQKIMQNASGADLARPVQKCNCMTGKEILLQQKNQRRSAMQLGKCNCSTALCL